MKTPDARELIQFGLELVNHVGLEGATASLRSSPGGGLALRLEFKQVTLQAGRFEGVHVDEGLILVEGLDPAAGAGALLDRLRIRVERLLVRVSPSLVNRIFDSDFFQAEVRRNAPVALEGLRLSFSMDRLSLEGVVRKGLGFPFQIDLFLDVVNQDLRIVFENFWAARMVPLPSFLRKGILSVAQARIAGHPALSGLVRIEEDAILIHPWSAVPVALEAEVTRFGIEGSYLILELSAPPVEASTPASSVQGETIQGETGQGETGHGASTPPPPARPPIVSTSRVGAGQGSRALEEAPGASSR